MLFNPTIHSSKFRRFRIDWKFTAKSPAAVVFVSSTLDVTFTKAADKNLILGLIYLEYISFHTIQRLSFHNQLWTFSLIKITKVFYRKFCIWWLEVFLSFIRNCQGWRSFSVDFLQNYVKNNDCNYRFLKLRHILIYILGILFMQILCAY